MEGDSADYTKIHFPFSSVTTGSPSSSCEIIILQNKSHSEFLRVCMAYLRPLLGIKNFIKTLNENTSLFFTQCIACYRPLTMLKKNPYWRVIHFYVYYVHMRLASLMYVVNLEMDNSPKWVLFVIVSGQITSNALWK